MGPISRFRGRRGAANSSLARHPDRAAAVGVHRRAAAARAPLLLEGKHCVLSIACLYHSCLSSVSGATQGPIDFGLQEMTMRVQPSLLRFAASSASGFLFAAAEKLTKAPVYVVQQAKQLISAPQLVRDTRNLMPKLRVNLDVVARARRCKIARAPLLL